MDALGRHVTSIRQVWDLGHINNNFEANLLENLIKDIFSLPHLQCLSPACLEHIPYTVVAEDMQKYMTNYHTRGG